MGVETNDVCHQCNSGWMSQLEHQTRSTLAPMITGSDLSLDNDHQIAVSKWAYKTAMIFDLIGNGRSGSYFNDQDRHEFEVSKAVPTPSRVHIYMAAFNGPHVASAIDYRVYFNIRDNPRLRDAEAYCSTISVGHLVLQVFVVRHFEDLRRVKPPFSTTEWEMATVCLWPVRNSLVRWPPDRVLDQAGYSALIDRWRPNG